MKICFIALILLPKNKQEIKHVFKSPPIAYLWLSAILLRGNHSVSILDANSFQLTEGEILKSLECEPPDIVGFTVFTNAFHNVIYMAKRIKERFPKIRIAVGGYHVNSIPSDFYLDCIDYIFTGEAEYSLLELINRLDAKNESKNGILGLHYRDEDGNWIVNPPQGFITNLDDMPFLPYEMILNNGYTGWWTIINPKRHKYMATITGKGCPMKCSFCDISKTEGVRYRAMSAERVIEELSYMSQLGITHIEFRDGCFTTAIKRLEKIAQEIIERRLKIKWECNGTIRNIKNTDDIFLKLLYNSGCRCIFFGVESGNPDILKHEKKVTPEQVYEVVKRVQKVGIQAHCSFIFGLEGETQETMKQTLDMALRLNAHTVSFSIATPYPGTKLYNFYKEKGYIKTFDWKLYGGEDPVFETEAISKEMFKSFLIKAHRKFYFRASYIWKRLKSVRSYEEIKTYALIAFKMLFDTLSYKR